MSPGINVFSYDRHLALGDGESCSPSGVTSNASGHLADIFPSPSPSPEWILSWRFQHRHAALDVIPQRDAERDERR